MTTTLSLQIPNNVLCAFTKCIQQDVLLIGHQMLCIFNLLLSLMVFKDTMWP